MNKRIKSDGNEKRLLDVSEMCNYIGMGKNRGVTFAREIGAEHRIGKRCLYDKKVIDAYFDNM